MRKRLRSIGDGAGLEQYGYERDARRRITDFRLENVRRGYSYDGNDQLLTSPFRGYSYDDNFNRLGTGTVIGKDNRLAQDGDWNYEYDANGNRIDGNRLTGADNRLKTDGTWDYRYLGEGNLKPLLPDGRFGNIGVFNDALDAGHSLGG